VAGVQGWQANHPTPTRHTPETFRILPKNVRIKRELGGETVTKGYERDQFTDAWGRYVPTEEPKVLEDEP
jgi:hypothetical protein